MKFYAGEGLSGWEVDLANGVGIHWETSDNASGQAGHDLRMRRSAAKTLEIDDGTAGNATLNVVGTLKVNGTALSANSGTSSRILYLDECNSATRPTGNSLSGTIGYDSTFNALKFHGGNGGSDTYTAATVTLAEGLTFECEWEITGGVASTTYFNPQRISPSAANVSYIQIGNDGTPKQQNAANGTQNTGTTSGIAVNKRYITRITYLATGRYAYSQIVDPAGTNYCSFSYSDTNITWGNGNTFGFQIVRPADASEVLYVYRVAIYNGTTGASVGQSQ
jgi:hypothetical protein